MPTSEQTLAAAVWNLGREAATVRWAEACLVSLFNRFPEPGTLVVGTTKIEVSNPAQLHHGRIVLLSCRFVCRGWCAMDDHNHDSDTASRNVDQGDDIDYGHLATIHPINNDDPA